MNSWKEAIDLIDGLDDKIQSRTGVIKQEQSLGMKVIIEALIMAYEKKAEDQTFDQYEEISNWLGEMHFSYCRRE